MADDQGVDLPPVRRLPLLGHVESFDDPRGIGVVESGDRRFDFHCTAITDGTRHIAEGTPVAFTVEAGHLGRFQASSVRPLGAVGAVGHVGASGALGVSGAPPG
jgi:cold shock CspA family protein